VGAQEVETERRWREVHAVLTVSVDGSGARHGGVVGSTCFHSGQCRIAPRITNNATHFVRNGSQGMHRSGSKRRLWWVEAGPASPRTDRHRTTDRLGETSIGQHRGGHRIDVDRQRRVFGRCEGETTDRVDDATLKWGRVEVQRELGGHLAVSGDDESVSRRASGRTDKCHCVRARRHSGHAECTVARIHR
jgi:hypothetical protein